MKRRNLLRVLTCGITLTPSVMPAPAGMNATESFNEL